MEKELNQEFTQLQNSDYAVNELGIVKNLKTGNIIHPFFIGGYSAVNITVNGKRKTAYVHHIMAEVFLGYIAKRGLMSINHINGCKNEPRLDNLEVITHRRNSALTFINKNRELPTGVTKNPIGIRRYKAQISYLGKNRYLGAYLTAEEASEVYEAAAECIIKTGKLPDYYMTRERYDRFKKPE
jgi:hypothetical protein